MHEGDPTVCSHPPSTVFDGFGAELGGVPLVPIERGSPEEAEFAARWKALLGDYDLAETLTCDARVVPP